MRLDIVLPNEHTFMLEAMNAGPHYEAMGWDGIWLSDHLLGIEEDHIHTQEWMDIFIAMTHLAANTKKVRIGSGVVVMPYRNPVLMARMLSTMDHLSGGRIDFGVGVGWLKRESQALGVSDSFEVRGEYTNEQLDVMLACWKGGMVEFHGKYFDFPPVRFEPTCAQEGGRPPLWIGTTAWKGAPIRRVAKYADVWHPSEGDPDGNSLTPAKFKELGDRIDEMAGRKIPRSIRLNVFQDPQERVDALHAYAEAGCVQAACSCFDYWNLPKSFSEFDKLNTRFWKAAESLRKA